MIFEAAAFLVWLLSPSTYRRWWNIRVITRFLKAYLPHRNTRVPVSEETVTDWPRWPRPGVDPESVGSHMIFFKYGDSYRLVVQDGILNQPVHVVRNLLQAAYDLWRSHGEVTILLYHPKCAQSREFVASKGSLTTKAPVLYSTPQAVVVPPKP